MMRLDVRECLNALRYVCMYILEGWIYVRLYYNGEQACMFGRRLMALQALMRDEWPMRARGSHHRGGTGDCR